MGIFKRRQAQPDMQWIELELSGWHTVQLPDPRASKSDFEVGMAWAARVADADEGTIQAALRETSAHLTALMPAISGLPRTPEDPSPLAADFVQGWLVASIEEASGLARRDGQSMASLLALLWLRGEPADDVAIVRGNLLEAGYFAKRSGLTPQSTVSAVVASA